jgi:hypothetical protein
MGSIDRLSPTISATISAEPIDPTKAEKFIFYFSISNPVHLKKPAPQAQPKLFSNPVVTILKT